MSGLVSQCMILSAALPQYTSHAALPLVKDASCAKGIFKRWRGRVFVGGRTVLSTSIRASFRRNDTRILSIVKSMVKISRIFPAEFSSQNRMGKVAKQNKGCHLSTQEEKSK